MHNIVRVPLDASPDQLRRLAALQREFAAACNALLPLTREHRCWNRVALHHLAYRQLRERFPALGSQMACNAIYSVSRACRRVYQHPASPYHVHKVGAAKLPRLRFRTNAPVFFDRHTLSISRGRASMFTLDGRMRFDLGIDADAEARFREHRLREIVLSSEGGRYWLSFVFADAAGGTADEADEVAQWPQYVLVSPDGARLADAAADTPLSA